MSFQGKALIWLHKARDGECEVSINGCTGAVDGHVWDDLYIHLDSYRRHEVWSKELDKMLPGDWVRFTIKWELGYHKSYDHYYGCYEYDSSIDVQRVRTLRRGHYPAKYETKRET